MSNAVKAVQALVNNYAINNDLSNQLAALFDGPENFGDKLSAFDGIFNTHPNHLPIKEFAFDLMMAYHLEMNQDDEDYFDSPEWQEIEDQTLERGTELLNILLYITEANDTDTSMALEDFLYDFLLVDEDEFQDEHRIYEELIANQELVEENINSILEVCKRIPDETEIKELFVPIILFFKDHQDNTPNREISSRLNPMDLSIWAALLAYNQG